MALVVIYEESYAVDAPSSPVDCRPHSYTPAHKPRFELGIEALQAPALPLGHATGGFKSVHYRSHQDLISMILVGKEVDRSILDRFSPMLPE